MGANPEYCPHADFDHSKDSEMTGHGSAMKPIRVVETRPKKYVTWEYDYIFRRIMYHKCFQQLLHDTDRSRDLDRIVVRDYTGNHYVFYFDVTEQMAAQNERMKKVHADYLAGKSIDPKDLAAIKGAKKLHEEYRKKYPGRG